MCKDGKAAVNFEHAWGDGVAVLRFFNEVNVFHKLNLCITSYKEWYGTCFSEILFPTDYSKFPVAFYG